MSVWGLFINFTQNPHVSSIMPACLLEWNEQACCWRTSAGCHKSDPQFQKSGASLHFIWVSSDDRVMAALFPSLRLAHWPSLVLLWFFFSPHINSESKCMSSPLLVFQPAAVSTLPLLAVSDGNVNDFFWVPGFWLVVFSCFSLQILASLWEALVWQKIG